MTDETILSTARTEDDIFQAFLAAHKEDGFRWREYWRDYYMDQLTFYYRQKWWVLPCGRFNKRPLSGWKWSSRKLKLQEMIWYAAAGYNLAACAGPSDLVILDYDAPDVVEFNPHTLSMATPKGGQFWCRGPYDEKLGDQLKKVGFDTPRHGIMYGLVPLSKTCTRDKGMNGCDCKEHDFRIREWVDLEEPIAPFSEVARRLLG